MLGQTATETHPSQLALFPRKYRSKRQRPCDLCRSRKTQCKISSFNAACELCMRLERNCTFVLQPLRKKRRQSETENATAGERQASLSDRSANALSDVEHPGSDIIDMDFGLEALLARQGSDPISPFNVNRTPNSDGLNWPSLDFASAPATIDNGIYNQQVNGNVAAILTSPSSQQTTDLQHDLAQHQSSVADESQIYNDTDAPSEYSLNERPGYSSQLIGLSNESDPFLLRHYLYDVRDNFPMFKLDFRKVVDDTTVQNHAMHAASLETLKIPANELPVQFVMTNEQIGEDQTPPIDPDISDGISETDDRVRLAEIVLNEWGSRLLKLFFKFVHPSYPVLSSRDCYNLGTGKDHNFPVGLRAAIYALAIPFCFLDDELSVQKGYRQPPTEELWAIAGRAQRRSFQTSHLETVQLCLLLLQRPPQNFAVADTPSSWALVCSALAAAESLGLHLDPSSWRLPKHEIRLRRRVWWMLYVEHTWRAVVLGRPSHLNPDHWDVSNLHLDDFDADDPMDQEDGGLDLIPIQYIIALSEISIIADETLRELYTVKAVRRASTLTDLLARTRPLMTRLHRWRDALPPVLNQSIAQVVDDEPSQCGPLRLCYLSMILLIFRALLRPLAYDPQASEENRCEPRSTIFVNSQSYAKWGIESIAALKAKHFVNFWPAYARYQLSYITNFILLIFIQSPTSEMASENKDLIDIWRNTARLQSRAWPVLKLAAMRLDAILWKGLRRTVTWAGLDSPAEALLRSQGSQGSASCR